MNLTAADLIERVLQERLDPDDAIRSYHRRVAPLGEAGQRLSRYLQKKNIPRAVAEGYARDIQEAFAWKTDTKAKQLLQEVCRGSTKANVEEAFAIFIGVWEV